MARSAKKQVLREKVSRGGYVVDPQAVAEAILRLAGYRTSSMFVALQPGQGSASGSAEDEPSPFRGLA
jgi:hypothetical protein